jgi:tripartite-type tricarboxylate transporter receptor subunit TctC
MRADVALCAARRRTVKRPRWRHLHRAASVAAVFSGLLFPDQAAWTQSARTIRIVVATPLGGPTDILANLFAEQISRSLGRTQGLRIVIENSPGAGGVIGTEAVSRSAPDGNTLLMTGNGFVINPYLQRVYYDPLTSFEPICNLASSPAAIVVKSTSHYRTLADLLDEARSNPGRPTMASFGPAGILHIAVEMLKVAANVNMTYVPYPSEIPAVNALLGAHVTSLLGSFRAVAPYLRMGTLRALAVTSRNRIEPLPEVSTVAESGYKDYEAEARLWLFAPARTPKEAVSQLAGWFTAAMQAAEVKAALAREELYPVGMCGADFGAYLRKQYDEYGRVIRGSKINVE